MPGLIFEKAHHTSNMQHNDRQRGNVFFSVCCKSFLSSDLWQLMSGRIGSPAAACSVAGGFCYGRLLDESCIVRESQNSPSPARASDRLLSICVHEKHDVLSFFLGKRSLPVLRFASCEAVVEEPGDRQKLEELSSRETRHPAVFTWQTQFAGAALRILRSRRGRSRGIGGSSRSFWIFRPCAGARWRNGRRRKIHRDETSAVPRQRVANSVTKRAARGQRTAWTGSTFRDPARSAPTQFAQAARPPRDSPLPD